MDKYSQHFACDRCGRSFEPLNPHNFSFNSPLGWCPTCEGLGVQQGANSALVIRDVQLSLRAGAGGLAGFDGECQFQRFADALAKHLDLSLDTPFTELTAVQQRALLQGTGEAWIPFGQRRRTGAILSIQGRLSSGR